MKNNIWLLMVNGFCALIWTLKVILDIATHNYDAAPFMYVLNTLCAVLSGVLFVMNLKKCRSQKKA